MSDIGNWWNSVLGKGPTITVFKYKKTNKIVGGFTSLPLAKNTYTDRSAFGFSLTDQRIMRSSNFDNEFFYQYKANSYETGFCLMDLCIYSGYLKTKRQSL